MQTAQSGLARGSKRAAASTSWVCESCGRHRLAACAAYYDAASTGSSDHSLVIQSDCIQLVGKVLKHAFTVDIYSARAPAYTTSPVQFAALSVMQLLCLALRHSHARSSKWSLYIQGFMYRVKMLRKHMVGIAMQDNIVSLSGDKSWLMAMLGRG